MTYLQQQQPPGPFESRDGDGAGDHDQPYQFGWRPRTSVPYPIAHASTHACWSSAADSRTVTLAKSRQMAPAQLSRLPERGHMSTKVQAPLLEARMDHVERLIEAFGARPSWSVVSKLDALLDLEQIDDPRIVPFLVQVLADQRELTDVRIHVLKQLRDGRLQPAQRQSVAQAILRIVSDRSSPELRLQAILVLAEFTDIDGMLATLGGLALGTGEPIDVRYSAFTSLQRAGPSTECVPLLRQLSADDAFGRSARTVLSSWHIE